VSLKDLEEVYEHGVEVEKIDPWQHFHPRNFAQTLQNKLRQSEA